MNILLFGPQGSGKGTQADMLSKQLKLYHLSMGDELRKEIKKKSPLGLKLKKIMDNGALVPYEITSDIAIKISKKKEAKEGIIFDGYPRSKEQWDFVKKNFKIGAAIELGIPTQESIRRISSRRVCPKCGRSYNIIWLKPKRKGYCDDDGTALKIRDDDTMAAVKKRLKIYRSQTEPLKKEYRKLGILYVINGKQPIQKVNKDVLKILKKR
jgi:adenylate kinase